MLLNSKRHIDRHGAEVNMIKFTTVELRLLELVGTVGASLTHPCVRAVPSLPIFKLVHVYFYAITDTTFFYRPRRCKEHVTPVTDTLEFK